MAVRRGVAGVLAALLLALITVSSLATVLTLTGYGQLLGGLPFAFTPKGSRLAVYNGDIGGVIGGPGSWLSQPVLQVTNAYRVIAVIPDDRFKAGYVLVWVN